MSTTNNNTNELRNKLSELDKVFIPEDLDEAVSLEELMSYQQNVKFWRTVPKNYSLVAQNIFTQEVRNVRGHGIKLVAPVITKTILVSNHTGLKNYTNVEAFSSDGISLKIDFSVIMKISNPAKYITDGKSQNKHIDAVIKRLLLSYISKFGFEHVVTGKCAINVFDPTDELKNFSNQYGIKVDSILIEKVTLPEHLRKLYNDTAEEIQKKKAQAIKLEADKEKAQNDAEISKLHAQAEATKITIVETAKADALATKLAKVSLKLKEEGLNEEQISKAIRTYIMSETGNVIYLGDNLEAKHIAAGITGSQEVNSSKTKTRHQ